MLGLRTRQSLHSIPPRHKPPQPLDYAAYLGTPGIAERRRQLKRERIYRWIWRIGMWTVLIIAVFLAGYNVRIDATEAQRRAEVVQEMGWNRIAVHVPQGKRRCRIDIHEGCLVCEHRALRGTIKSTMC